MFRSNPETGVFKDESIVNLDPPGGHVSAVTPCEVCLEELLPGRDVEGMQSRRERALKMLHYSNVHIEGSSQIGEGRDGASKEKAILIGGEVGRVTSMRLERLWLIRNAGCKMPALTESPGGMARDVRFLEEEGRIYEIYSPGAFGSIVDGEIWFDVTGVKNRDLSACLLSAEPDVLARIYGDGSSIENAVFLGIDGVSETDESGAHHGWLMQNCGVLKDQLSSLSLGLVAVPDGFFRYYDIPDGERDGKTRRVWFRTTKKIR